MSYIGGAGLLLGMQKKENHVAIVAGGTLDASMLPRIRQAALVIGADRGALWLLNHGIIPDVAVGDFDSVTAKERLYIEQKAKQVIPYQPAKDATDLELAASVAIAHKPELVSMFGVIGSRFDHSLAGIQVLHMLSSHNVKGYIVDNFCKISIVVRRVERVEKTSTYTYFSIFPFHGDAVVSLRGCAYPVTRKRFIVGSTLGVSNQIRAQYAYVHVHTGAVILVQSRD
jgi:thiamine pyrophosphokinase